MEYQVSARKWRPQTFEEVIGQKHIATVLRNAIRLEKIAHAYLFSGIRGVGKTSLARILAKAVNCDATLHDKGEEAPCNQCDSCCEITEGRSVDVIEIDGASNTGVDDVRELRERVKYLPLRGKYKVYIIDEVHMLSNPAFNALLKTLEEPPPHLIFILATTEAHKIPATILSRCQHLTFRQIARAEIVSQLGRISQARKVPFSDRGLLLIARVAEGSMRDALTLLDQAISYGGEEVTDEDLFALMGRMGEGTFHLLVQAIHKKDAETLLGLAGEIAEKGCDLRHFLADWMEHLRHLIVSGNVPEAAAWIDQPEEEIDEIKSEAALFSAEELQRLFSLFVRLQGEIRFSPSPHLLFEVALMKSILMTDLQPIERMIERLDTLQGGGIAQVERKPSLSKEKVKVFPDVQNKKAVDSPPSGLPLTQASWEVVLSDISKARPNIGSYLEQGRFLGMDDGMLRLGYSEESSFLIPLVQKEGSIKWLASFLENRFQRKVKLCLSTLSKSETSSPTVSGLEKSEGLRQQGAVSNPHPLVQEALRVLGGKVIETKKG
ncbi:MAG: DNA polymerase III subunit gamma/tau [Nitrospira sp.]|nr:DNA polymerase III subunit gamma/tau [Candidatus Manganitrophaceae bacterium]HIL34474.1 DNA polymerase III subunit gamma/tau [Candidatus Manganitrophaceae bacterium]